MLWGCWCFLFYQSLRLYFFFIKNSVIDKMKNHIENKLHHLITFILLQTPHNFLLSDLILFCNFSHVDRRKLDYELLEWIIIFYQEEKHHFLIFANYCLYYRLFCSVLLILIYTSLINHYLHSYNQNHIWLYNICTIFNPY